MPALLDWLFTRPRFSTRPGLERTRALLELIASPQTRFDSILIGGTNGKGSTAATLSSILHSAGKRSALFTSPHLTHFNERFVVSGQELEERVVLEALADIQAPAEALGATFFEIVTALGCLLFARAEVELAVIEVGMGGRYDATNVLEPLLSIITGVALDHTQVLGATVEAIAADKAGIMRAGKRVLTGAHGGALEVLRTHAQKVGAELWVIGERLELRGEALGWNGLQGSLQSPCGENTFTSPLIGAHQLRNVALAVAAAQALGIPNEAITEGTARARWAGRLEPIRYRERTFLLDGAHNPEAAEALARTLKTLHPEPVQLIFGLSGDKDALGTVAPLAPLALEVILTQARSSPRALSAAELEPLWSVPSFATENPEEALELALSRSEPGDLILVAGSLYLLGDLRPLLLGE